MNIWPIVFGNEEIGGNNFGLSISMPPNQMMVMIPFIDAAIEPSAEGLGFGTSGGITLAVGSVNTNWLVGADIRYGMVYSFSDEEWSPKLQMSFNFRPSITESSKKRVKNRADRAFGKRRARAAAILSIFGLGGGGGSCAALKVRYETAISQRIQYCRSVGIEEGCFSNWTNPASAYESSGCLEKEIKERAESRE